MVALLLALVVDLHAQTSPLIFATSGPYTFKVPAGVTSIKVECWGGGGSSGNNTTGRAKGGGGGGAFTGGILTVLPGSTLSIVVGSRGRYNNIATATDDGGQSSVGIIVAKGGLRGSIGANLPTNGGAGGIVSTNPNPGIISAFISYAGGNGGNGYVAGDNGGGGGGGESASSTGIGNPGGNGTNTGIGGAGGSGNPGGGDGGRGASNQNNSKNSDNGHSPGGGGGGRADDHGSDTDGADGKVIITWDTPVGYCVGNAISVSYEHNVGNHDRALGNSDHNGAHLNEIGDQIELMLTNGNLLTAGGSVNVTWRKNSILIPSIKVEVSETGVGPWITINNYLVITRRNAWTTQSIPLPVNARYIRFTSNNGINLDLDAVSFNTPCIPPCTTPLKYSLTGGGCFGGTGLPISLSGSEAGLSYQLYQGATPKDPAILGTGLPLSFAVQPAGTYTVVSTRAIGCTSKMIGNAIVSFNSIPATPSAIAGEISPCIGSSQIYSVTDVPGVSYTWTFPADWSPQTIVGTTNSIVVTVGTSAGSISVKPYTTCQTGTQQVLTVTPVTMVLPLNISANYCIVAGKILLSANGGDAGDTYLWNTGESTKDILVNTADQYSVTMTSATGCSGSSTYNTATELIVNGDFTAGNTGITSAYTFITSAPGALIPGNNYTIAPDPNISHTDYWGEDHTTNDGNFMIVNGNGSATVWTQKVNVLPNTDYNFSAWAISLNDEISNSNLSFSINGVEQPLSRTGALPTGAISNVGPFEWVQFEGKWNSVLVSGTVDVTIGVFVAGSAASGFGLDDISFSTIALIPFIIAPTSDLTTLCEGIQLKLFANLTGGKPPYSYKWTGPDGIDFSTDKDPVISNVIAANSGDYTLTVTDGFGCDAVSAYTNVIITPTVGSPVFTSGPTTTRCQGAGTATYSATAANSTEITYSLDAASISGGNTIVSNTGEATFVAAWSGTTIITASAAGCNGPSTVVLTLETTTSPVTIPVFAKGTNSSRYQSAETITYTATAINTSGITYSLDAASVTGGNSIETATGNVTYVAGWSGTSTITASAAGCDGPKSAIHTVSTTWCFALFTAIGAVTNNGASCITGDVGTNDGAYTGFTTATMVGQSHVEDCISLQAAADVVTAYNDLAAIHCGIIVSGTSLGINPVLTPNVYYLGGALNIGGDVILDGQGDPESKFIFQVNGALSTLTNSRIILINSAKIENVYWQVNGAIELGAGSVFIGTIVCNGAITLLTGATLMGRALTTVGAIVLNNNVIISTCSPILGVTNNVKPTFLLPDPFIECVESLSSAIYDPLTIDINTRPDYYTFKSGNKLLDLTGMDNNCCSIESMTIKWRIDFTNGTFLEGTGQPSVHGSDIRLPGDGVTFINLVHTITYTLVGCTGTESLPQTLNITIRPRPNITKVNQ